MAWRVAGQSRATCREQRWNRSTPTTLLAHSHLLLLGRSSVGSGGSDVTWSSDPACVGTRGGGALGSGSVMSSGSGVTLGGEGLQGLEEAAAPCGELRTETGRRAADCDGIVIMADCTVLRIASLWLHVQAVL